MLTGPHSDEKQEDSEFWRSSTVSNAANGKIAIFKLQLTD